MYNIPILFIIFKRKEIALKSFQQIKTVKPKKLYLAGDGARPKRQEELKNVESTRQAILDEIDWNCEVHTLFHKQNFGCSIGVFSAINWFFENEELGIILEDDCIAEISFFSYTKELLLKYKDDNRIGMIAGTNQISNHKIPYSYCFSRYAACWGWATWKRAWKNMDLTMYFLKSASCKRDILCNRGYYAKEINRWLYQIKYIEKKRVSSWDWQWYFSLASQNQLCIFPKVNLISNIGNDKDATHTGLGNVYIKSYPIQFPLTHPKYIVPSEIFDKHFYETDNSLMNRLKRIIPYNFKKKIKKSLKDRL